MWLREMGHMFKILSLFHVSESNLEVEVSCLKILGGHLVLVSTPTFSRKVIVFCFQVCRLRSGVSLVLSFRCSLFIRKDSRSFCCSPLSARASPNSCSCVQSLKGSGWHLESAQETCPGVVGRGQAPGNVRPALPKCPVVWVSCGPCHLWGPVHSAGVRWGLRPAASCSLYLKGFVGGKIRKAVLGPWPITLTFLR